MKRFTFTAAMASTLLLAVTSCGNSQKQTTANETAQTVVEQPATTADYYGVYEGTLPGADNEGIKTTLTLNEDNTYQLKSEYIGKKDGTFEESGVFNKLDNDVLELTNSSSNEKTYYKLLNGEVAVSDSLGNMNQGELAEQYKLKKQ